MIHETKRPWPYHDIRRPPLACPVELVAVPEAVGLLGSRPELLEGLDAPGAKHPTWVDPPHLWRERWRDELAWSSRADGEKQWKQGHHTKFRANISWNFPGPPWLLKSREEKTTLDVVSDVGSLLLALMASGEVRTVAAFNEPVGGILGRSWTEVAPTQWHVVVGQQDQAVLNTLIWTSRFDLHNQRRSAHICVSLNDVAQLSPEAVFRLIELPRPLRPGQAKPWNLMVRRCAHHVFVTSGDIGGNATGRVRGFMEQHGFIEWRSGADIEIRDIMGEPFETTTDDSQFSTHIRKVQEYLQETTQEKTEDHSRD
jgi:hypothetical protein